MPFTAAGVAAAAAVGGVGIAAAGAAGAFAPDSPQAPNYAAQTRDAQQAQIDLLPDKYAARAKYDPMFAALTRNEQYDNLFGTQAGSPGMIAMAQRSSPQLDQIKIDSQNRQTAANLDRLKLQGPEAFKAIQGFDPFASSLSDQLLTNAQEELSAGRRMTRSQEADALRAVRAGQGSRGLGYGPADVFQEALYMGDRGEQQLNRRQAYASSILGQRSGLYGRAYEALGLSPGQSADAGPYLGAAGQRGPDLTAINPAAYQYGLAGYGAQQNAAMAGYNSQMGGLGSVASGLGGIFKVYANQPSTPNVGNGYNTYQGSGYSGYPTA